MEKTERPWGCYEVLFDSEFTKVKKITVKPGGKLSLQYHKFRNEHWVIVSGIGVVTMEKSNFSAKANDHFYIASSIKHRIENSGEEDLIFIETQTGSYFGEDDIIRVEDVYNRLS
jgi:mannose-1-phosphate guanylyltransferase